MRRNVTNVVLGLFVAIMFGMTGCGGGDSASATNSSVPNITSVTYRTTSGSINPGSAWEETYTISSDGLTFSRIGFTATSTVNAGTWLINAYGPNETKLFSDLSGPDVLAVDKTGQNPPRLGGGTTDYTIQYDNRVKKEVIIGDGSIYNNAALITAPIHNYIASIALPPDASNRYK